VNNPHLCWQSLMPSSRDFEVGSLWRCPDCATLWRLKYRVGRRTWVRAGRLARLFHRRINVRLYPATTQ
jgi:hypothetical protein